MKLAAPLSCLNPLYTSCSLSLSISLAAFHILFAQVDLVHCDFSEMPKLKSAIALSSPPSLTANRSLVLLASS